MKHTQDRMLYRIVYMFLWMLAICMGGAMMFGCVVAVYVATNRPFWLRESALLIALGAGSIPAMYGLDWLLKRLHYPLDRFRK